MKRTSLRKNRKGDAFVLLSGIVVLFVLGAIYLLLREGADQVYITMNDTTYNYTFQGGHHETSVNQIYTMFKWYPIVIVLSLFLWAILNSIRRTPDEIS